jgi:hypothetical protein
MTITASKLRENVYRILDNALETGRPVEVIRKGKRLKIVPETRRDRLAKLKKRPGAFTGEVEEIIGMDWSGRWNPDGNL